MEMTILHARNPIPVVIFHLQGELDGSANEALIQEARKQYRAGFRNLLLDFSFVTSLGSAGFSALQAVAMLFIEGEPSGHANGRARSALLSKDPADEYHEHVKLLHVPEDVKKTLGQAGYASLFETYTDLHQAVASFH